MTSISDWFRPPVVYARFGCDWPDGVFFDLLTNIQELDPKSTKALAISKIYQGPDLDQFTCLPFLDTRDVSQDFFDQIGRCKSLDYLRVKSGSKPLANLKTSAEYLSFSSCKKLENFSFFKSSPKKVKGLGLSECSAFSSLDAVTEFRNLHELYIDGPLSGKKSKFQSLEPLSQLSKIEYLGVAGRLADASIEPLHALSKLKQLWIPCSHKAKENELIDLLSNCKQLEEIHLRRKLFRRGVGFVEKNI